MKIDRSFWRGRVRAVKSNESLKRLIESVYGRRRRILRTINQRVYTNLRRVVRLSVVEKVAKDWAQGGGVDVPILAFARART